MDKAMDKPMIKGIMSRMADDHEEKKGAPQKVAGRGSMVVHKHPDGHFTSQQMGEEKEHPDASSVYEEMEKLMPGGEANLEAEEENQVSRPGSQKLKKA